LSVSVPLKPSKVAFVKLKSIAKQHASAKHDTNTEKEGIIVNKKIKFFTDALIRSQFRNNVSNDSMGSRNIYATDREKNGGERHRLVTHTPHTAASTHHPPASFFKISVVAVVQTFLLCFVLFYDWYIGPSVGT